MSLACLSRSKTRAVWLGRHRQVKYSLQCRGKHVEDMNKDELLELLYDDILLEKKVCCVCLFIFLLAATVVRT